MYLLEYVGKQARLILFLTPEWNELDFLLFFPIEMSMIKGEPLLRTKRESLVQVPAAFNQQDLTYIMQRVLS